MNRSIPVLKRSAILCGIESQPEREVSITKQLDLWIVLKDESSLPSCGICVKSVLFCQADLRSIPSATWIRTFAGIGVPGVIIISGYVVPGSALVESGDQFLSSIPYDRHTQNFTQLFSH